MLTEIEKELADHLIALSLGIKKPEYEEYGLCTELHQYCFPHRISVTPILDAITLWAIQNDLDPMYPIEGSHRVYVANGRKWDNRTNFGNKRAQLCIWLAEAIKNNQVKVIPA